MPNQLEEASFFHHHQIAFKLMQAFINFCLFYCLVNLDLWVLLNRSVFFFFWCVTVTYNSRPQNRYRHSIILPERCRLLIGFLFSSIIFFSHSLHLSIRLSVAEKKKIIYKMFIQLTCMISQNWWMFVNVRLELKHEFLW